MNARASNTQTSHAKKPTGSAVIFHSSLTQSTVIRHLLCVKPRASTLRGCRKGGGSVRAAWTWFPRPLQRQQSASAQQLQGTGSMRRGLPSRAPCLIRKPSNILAPRTEEPGALRLPQGSAGPLSADAPPSTLAAKAGLSPGLMLPPVTTEKHDKETQRRGQHQTAG